MSYDGRFNKITCKKKRDEQSKNQFQTSIITNQDVKHKLDLLVFLLEQERKDDKANIT